MQNAQALKKKEINKVKGLIKIAEERADKDIKAAKIEVNERIAQIESDWPLGVYEERAMATKRIQDMIEDLERVKKQSEEAILDARGNAEVQIEEMQIKSDTLVVDINKAVPFSFLSSFIISPKRLVCYLYSSNWQIAHFIFSSSWWIVVYRLSHFVVSIIIGQRLLLL